MLTIATVVLRSPIHGNGCFAGGFVRAGEMVWRFDPDLDRAIPAAHIMTAWERIHAYKSVSATADHLWILPRDNAAFINFSNDPSLTMGRIVEGEPCLIAARDIFRWEELTVGTETDADAAWKLSQ